mmetsp:Transcript_13328/g.49856  ORF Transcript_13328/g.49856 Transcript_13328/m.49856 type:complete len:215 (+) Transcript_13328:588-1232(+)
MSGIMRSMVSHKIAARSRLYASYSLLFRSLPSHKSNGSLPAVYTWMMCFPFGATALSSTVGMNIVTTFCGSPKGRAQSRTHRCEGSKSGNPVASMPRNRCMMDPSAGISAMSSAQSAACGRPWLVSSSLFGNKGMVSHTVAFDTTAIFARATLPPFNRTPVASPFSTTISSTCFFNSRLPPNFSSAPTNLSTTACVPPTGAHRLAPGRWNPGME